MSHGRPLNGPAWSVAPKDWGARVDYDKWTDRYSPDDSIALHHGGSGNYVAGKTPYSVEEEMTQLRAWERWHIDGQGWRGLAYGWGLGQSGTVYRIRGWNTYGAHTGDIDKDGIPNNSEVIPVIWIASGNHHTMSPQAHESLVKLRRYFELETHRPLPLKGHQEVQSGTACPGPNGMAYVRANRNLSPDIPEETYMFAKHLNEAQWRTLYRQGVAKSGSEEALIKYWVKERAERTDAEWGRASAGMFTDAVAGASGSQHRDLGTFLKELAAAESGPNFVRWLLPWYRKWANYNPDSFKGEKGDRGPAGPPGPKGESGDMTVVIRGEVI